MGVREPLQIALARAGRDLDTEIVGQSGFIRDMEHAFRQGDDLELGRLMRRAIERELREATWR